MCVHRYVSFKQKHTLLLREFFVCQTVAKVLHNYGAENFKHSHKTKQNRHFD